ncbi:CLUMA_CG005798, isoform A [Clunio marinus]|uniref:CLUMA_CG005798, isoform A n=1 Tax=Clunio marinus TaxID=568069 RepID=A0A1J1HW63_9DIPT|nr:CLUMA_CG005798, isoform A [Clunio marinus]
MIDNKQRKESHPTMLHNHLQLFLFFLLWRELNKAEIQTHFNPTNVSLFANCQRESLSYLKLASEH